MSRGRRKRRRGHVARRGRCARDKFPVGPGVMAQFADRSRLGECEPESEMTGTRSVKSALLLILMLLDTAVGSYTNSWSWSEQICESWKSGFCGTKIKSPGRRCMSSRRSRESSIFLRSRTWVSATSAETRRNNTTCECRACCVKPPAIAIASFTVTSPRSSYLPGLATSPEARKNGLSKSFKVRVISGSCRKLRYASAIACCNWGSVSPSARSCPLLSARRSRLVARSGFG